MTSEERYKNGKIYTIRYRGDDSLIYVGSTCLPLYKRMYKHKYSCFILSFYFTFIGFTYALFNFKFYISVLYSNTS